MELAIRTGTSRARKRELLKMEHKVLADQRLNPIYGQIRFINVLTV